MYPGNINRKLVRVGVGVISCVLYGDSDHALYAHEAASGAIRHMYPSTSDRAPFFLTTGRITSSDAVFLPRVSLG